MNTKSGQSADTFSSRYTPEETAFEPTGDFAAALGDFRSAVHQAAGRATAKPVATDWLMPARRRLHSAQRRLVVAWTCAAVLCAGVLPLLHHGTAAVPHPAAVAIQHQTNDTDDTALLEQVDSAVSESVPTSLAPLAALDSWSSTTSTNDLSTESPLNNSEKKNAR
jgi:hypothetical protein